MPPVATVSMCEPHITGGPVLPPRAGADHVADGVDGHVQAGVAHPHGDQVPAFPVGVGQGQAGAPAPPSMAPIWPSSCSRRTAGRR